MFQEFTLKRKIYYLPRTHLKLKCDLCKMVKLNYSTQSLLRYDKSFIPIRSLLSPNDTDEFCSFYLILLNPHHNHLNFRIYHLYSLKYFVASCLISLKFVFSTKLFHFYGLLGITSCRNYERVYFRNLIIINCFGGIKRPDQQCFIL